MLRTELIIAVLALLLGCGGDGNNGPACLTTTPSPPDVSGTWVLSNQTLASSTCPQEIDDIVLASLSAAGPCPVTVQQSGNAFFATDCDGDPLSGCVDADGIITASQPVSSTDQGCTVSAVVKFSANSSQSESSAVFVYPFRFTGTCAAQPPCEIVIDSSWTRELGDAEGAASGERSGGAAAIVRNLAEARP